MPVGVRIISINRPSFIKGRFIFESVVATQEVIHDVHSKNHSGLVLKPNCEKTYDCMNWDILDKMLESKRLGLFGDHMFDIFLSTASFVLGSMILIVATSLLVKG